MSCRAIGYPPVTGDRYSAQWVSTMFLKFGIALPRIGVGQARDSPSAAQPLFSQRIVELLDVPKLAGSCCALDVRGARTVGI